ncbi:MAG: TraR/DksA C4-type zinc finger protein [Candidatus Marinimicrobia bacterium]|nr:TraR/DksA C4-type zinc finger protein [Candidatus Neomarinimicrobiota bacterium]MCH7955637.1 TraR/DksA C4-type zinc finger protein [Candidatus Neomarinimicrobiota bacterium]
MNKKDKEYYKKLILEKRENLVDELSMLKETALDDSSRKSSGNSSSYSYHMADLGTDSQEREKAYLFLARENKYLRYLNEALERIERGVYGICKICEKPIPKARLKAVSHATMCVPCKTEYNENNNQ